MGDPLDSYPAWKPPHPPHQLEIQISSWLVTRFGLNTPRDKDIWLFCIGAAMELERLAVGVLWVDDGRPKPFPEYKPKFTLGAALQDIEKRRLLDDSTRKILRDVADLRNSVAHRHAVFMTAPSPIEGQPVGEYRGYHVFIYWEEALDKLIRDFETAAQAMRKWMAARAPDLVEDALSHHEPGDTSGPDTPEEGNRETS